MKQYYTFLLFFIILTNQAFAQGKESIDVTPKILLEIKAAVDKEVPAFKQRLIKSDIHNDRTAEQLEFSVDTFRIERITVKRMGMDFSTVGMNNTEYARADDYDKILNKYYNRLLKVLKPTDKAILINAQRAWITYRDSETKLIGLITGSYSGGGTIQTTIESAEYTEIIVKRTITIFEYYDIVTNKM